jgi:pyruvate dehydrogenase E1 component alpha subunit
MEPEQAVLDRAPDEPYRVLDDDGTVVDGAAVPDLADEELLAIYREMRTARVFDERMVSLQRQGRSGTYSPLAGQEATQVASTHALREDDWISYQYREHGAVVVRGLTPEYVRYWMGDEAGNAALVDRHIVPLNISIAGHIPHATGMAWAAKLKGDETVVACHFGDGATSEGDFHEGLNFAGVFDVPAVFFCHNNQWAISVPRERQTASETIAGKADAYGFEGVQVDGMDPLACYAVSRAAVERARDPESESRPTLVETLCYRFGAHTTADDPSAYRDESEVDAWRGKDPIPRLEAFLREEGLLDDERCDAIAAESRDRVDEVVRAAESVDPDPTELFAHAVDGEPRRVREGREHLDRLRERHGDDALRRDE